MGIDCTSEADGTQRLGEGQGQVRPSGSPKGAGKRPKSPKSPKAIKAENKPAESSSNAGAPAESPASSPVVANSDATISEQPSSEVMEGFVAKLTEEAGGKQETNTTTAGVDENVLEKFTTKLVQDTQCEDQPAPPVSAPAPTPEVIKSVNAASVSSGGASAATAPANDPLYDKFKEQFIADPLPGQTSTRPVDPLNDSKPALPRNLSLASLCSTANGVPDWAEALDIDSNLYYYWNEQTGAKTWTHPDEAVELAEPFQEWWSVPAKDENGQSTNSRYRFYYWNTSTQEVSWSRPNSRMSPTKSR